MLLVFDMNTEQTVFEPCQNDYSELKMFSFNKQQLLFLLKQRQHQKKVLRFLKQQRLLQFLDQV